MGRTYFSTGLGTWPFLGQIAKIWSFSQVVWPQIFCLAFCKYFWKFGRPHFGLIWMWCHILEFKHWNVSMRTPTSTPPWQLKFHIPTPENGDSQRHNDHCYVINWSNFYSAVYYFLNALTTATRAVEPEPELFRWWSRSLKVGFRFKRVVQIIPCFFSVFWTKLCWSRSQKSEAGPWNLSTGSTGLAVTEAHAELVRWATWFV